MRINNYKLLTQERQLALLRSFLKFLRVVLVALTVHLSLPLLFSLFSGTEGVSRQLLSYVLRPVQRVVLAAVRLYPTCSPSPLSIFSPLTSCACCAF